MTAEVLDVIEELREDGLDFILVTHNMGFAKRIADKVAMIANGRIIEKGTGEHAFDQLVSQQSRDFLAKVLKY